MGRSVWKGPFIAALDMTQSPPLAQRAATILPSHVGKTVGIHNGKSAVQLLVTEEMISRKFGEFAKTQKEFSFKKKDDQRKRK